MPLEISICICLPILPQPLRSRHEAVTFEEALAYCDGLRTVLGELIPKDKFWSSTDMNTNQAGEPTLGAWRFENLDQREKVVMTAYPRDEREDEKPEEDGLEEDEDGRQAECAGHGTGCRQHNRIVELA